jgi:esterase/lipase superfamily enzyme
MEKEVKIINSKHLGKETSVASYGRYGLAILLFPATTDKYTEAEENGLIDKLARPIEKGKCKIFTVESVNFESWLDKNKSDKEKSDRLYEYNSYILEEVMPYVFGECGGPVPVITAGAGIGAYHAANTYFRRPDVFYGTIALSGTYNIEHFSNGYFDENCYFNSPVHYLPNLRDNYWLSFLMSRHHVYMLSGSGDGEFPENTAHISSILSEKGVPHYTDFWGKEWGHNWETWNEMFLHLLESKL